MSIVLKPPNVEDLAREVNGIFTKASDGNLFTSDSDRQIGTAGSAPDITTSAVIRMSGGPGDSDDSGLDDGMDERDDGYDEDETGEGYDS